MRRLLIVIIAGYRACLSPFLGSHCRFYPSCSAYAQEAIETHGVARGLLLSLKRISRCHPWHEGGADPVPPCSHDGPETGQQASSHTACTHNH